MLTNLSPTPRGTAPASSPLRVAVAREAAHVAVSVSDEGPGVAPERLPHLSRRHAGVGQGFTAGHGLGLAISKGLVEAHGGRIRAESAGPGSGTTFTFTVPVAGEPVAAAGHAAGPPRILVVDDDPRMLRFVRDAFSEAGYAPLVTGAPEELALQHPDREAATGPARPGAARCRRHRADAAGTGSVRRADPLHLRLPPGRDRRAGARGGGGRLHRQALLADGVGGKGAGGAQKARRAEPFVVGALAIDYAERLVTVGGEAVELTATEYELLRVLSLDAERAVTFDTLLRRIWPKRENADANVVRIFVRDLRRKLGDSAASPAWIFNRRGVGYRMATPAGR